MQIENKITNKIKVPELRNKYPFLLMKVGDSFYSKSKTQLLLTAAKKVINKRNLNWKFITRSENKGSRIWRIK